MPKGKNPRQPGERYLRSGPPVFIIARHRESTPSFLSLEMDKSVSELLTPWRTWDNGSESPCLDASVSRLESNQGVILRGMTIKSINAETLISSVR